MPVHNADIAALLDRLGELLEIEGANPFRVRAYRNAARTIQDLPHSVESMLAAGADLSELPGIGEDLAGKIREIVETGGLHLLDDVQDRLPGGLIDLTRVAGLGPKRIKLLHERLGLRGLDDLAAAAKAGKIGALPGFGKKTEAKILAEIGRLKGGETRTKLNVAEQIVEPLLAYLKETEGVTDAVAAGSYRRRKDTVGDADILVTCRKGAAVTDRFVDYEDVAQVVAKGPTRSTVLLKSGFQVDLRVVPQASYGAALHYFTGSKAHNIAVRALAARKGLKLNEYGVFKGNKRVAGRTEAEVFARVNLPYIEPELREQRGEIEAARAGRLPKLVALADIRGDLHVHSKASDGKYTIAEMAAAGRERGYAYIAIADHSKHVAVAHGLDAKRLARQIAEIDRLNERLDGIRVLKSAEVDILADGTLDLPDSILDELDLTVCAVHYKFDLPADQQTERIIRAMDNPRFNVLAHPTGRLINERAPYALDLERLMRAALDRGCLLELNAHPDRLDLDDIHCKMAKDMGLKLAVSTDAHAVAGLDFMRFGIDQARRGWLEAADLLNTRNWTELTKLLRRR
ncbi:MAG: DNA polymerase/3'-5' exonuclease PolX [Dongiaceae bacterium]